MILRQAVFILLLLFCSSALADDRAIKYPDNLSELKDDSFFSVSAAFLAGVYDYDAGWPDLPGVKADLNAVSGMLQSRGFHVEKAYNLNKNEYLAKLDAFISKYAMEPRARLLIYFAGHGHTVSLNGEKTGYIVLKDAAEPSKDMDGFLRGSVPMSVFSDRARDINTPQVLYMFDSCFSGSVFSAMRSIPERLAELLKKPVRQFISSGTENQMVPDDSVFRRRFLQALAGDADLNSDQLVTGSELGEYLRSAVSAYTAGIQTPVYGKLNGFDGEFVFLSSAKPSVVKPEGAKPAEGEKEELLEIIKENPHSPDALAALERLREIDESLKNNPPVDAPERKDFVMTAKSAKRVSFSEDNYPYIVIAPLNVPSMSGGFKTALRLKANSRKSYKKMLGRREMIKSVVSRRLNESNLQLVTDLAEIRNRIKEAAYDGAEWVCSGCLDGEPSIAGLAGL